MTPQSTELLADLRAIGTPPPGQYVWVAPDGSKVRMTPEIIRAYALVATAFPGARLVKWRRLGAQKNP